jgi:hypothetical protein
MAYSADGVSWTAVNDSTFGEDDDIVLGKPDCFGIREG